MSILYTQQYRPLTNEETTESDGLSSRFYRDAVRNANVLKGRAGPRFRATIHDLPIVKHGLGVAGNRVLLGETVIHTRVGFTHLTFKVWTAKTGAGNNITLTAYSDRRVYTGASEPFDISALTPDFEAAAVSVTSTTPNWYTINVPIVQAEHQRTCILLAYLTPADGNTLEFGYCHVQFRELT